MNQNLEKKNHEISKLFIYIATVKDGIGNYLFDFVGVILIVKDGIRFGNYLFDFVGVVDRQAARKDPHFSKCLMHQS